MASLTRTGAAAGDSDEVRLKKTLLTAAALMIGLAGVVWGALYFAAGEALAAAVPLTYSALSFLSIAMFSATRRYEWFSFSQLSLILLLPFVLQLVLGGYTRGSAVVLWSLLAPLGALAFADPRQAARWFAAYAGVVVASGLLEGAVRRDDALTPDLVLLLFVLNVTGVSLVAFVLLASFAVRRDHALRLVVGLFRQYLPRDVATSLLADPAQTALGGAVCEVTVLFADLRGYTTFSERAPPQEVVALLNRYFGVVVPAVTAQGGTVVQFIGDAVMAVFNAPVPQPRHPLRAARAALTIQRSIEEMARGDPELPRFRVGIHTGPALVGNVGSAEMRSFTAIGDTPNLASRLQATAEPGQVVISGTTQALIRDVAEARPLGRMRVRGKDEEVDAFQLLALRE
ncbi:MAG: adenylate/guanylate cyclase domain-containing protein [Candidatus Limnocylindria bacterium]